MPKMRLVVALPLIQLTIGVLLLRSNPAVEGYVPSRRVIYWGLNSSAMAFRILDRIDWSAWHMPRAALGLERDDIFLLLGAGIVWFFVGKEIERATSARERRLAPKVWMISVSLLRGGLAVLCLIQGLSYLVHPLPTTLYPIDCAVLPFLWSISLLVVSVRGALHGLAWRQPTSYTRGIRNTTLQSGPSAP